MSSVPPVKRVLDANANRAREALRVMEDAARFVADHAELATRAKTLRHDLGVVLRPLGGLELARDTPGDVGTGTTTGTEMRRTSIADVVAAAGKRLGEALRSLEEFAKLVDPVVAAGVEQIRYRAYDLERRMHAVTGAWAPRQWRVCVLLTESLCSGRSWESVALAAIDGGADCLQLREKSLDDATLAARARRLVELAPEGVSVVINDRPDVALMAGAHGVHLGRTDLPCAGVRAHAGRQLVIGVSTSRLEEAEQAFEDGADVCGVGPMFASDTKKKDRISGPAYLSAYASWGRLPHLAIGGITPGNVGELVAAGVQGVAVSSAVCGADDPSAVVAALRAAIESGASNATAPVAPDRP